MLQLLTGASIVSLIIGVIQEGLAEVIDKFCVLTAQGWLEGFAIFVAVFLIVTVTATNNYLRDQQFQKLNNKREQRDVSVIRGGQVVQLSVFDLLVGDIMLVETGENLPVDGICIKANSIQSLTIVNSYQILLLMNPQSQVKVT